MPGNNQTLLSCRGVSVRFGGVTALDHVDFLAPKGDITSIIGPNGAGKTTLLNAVTGLVGTSGGAIEFAGKDIAALPPFRRGLAGVVRTFQNLEIFSNMSVLENVMTGCHRHVRYSMLDCLFKTPRYRKEEKRCRDVAEEKLDFMGLAEKKRLPATDLPFGSQRLLELARALAAEPELLLLDEPAAGLNMKETRNLSQIIRRITNELKITIVLVEHDMDLVMHISDRVMVLNYGRTIAEGTPKEVQKNPDVVTAYLGEDEDE